MKSILLIGLGRFGKYIAKKLNDLNHEVMAIDTDEDRVNSILPFVTNAQIGDSTNYEFMESLGVDNYDVCIVAIGDNFQNSLETAFRNGADQVVYPEKQLAAWTAITCTSDSIIDYIALNKEFAIFELAVPADWYGRTVIEIDIRKKYGINVLGIKKDDRLNTNITPDTVFEPNTTVLVLGQDKAVHKAFRV